jgi:hypothetical protein
MARVEDEDEEDEDEEDEDEEDEEELDPNQAAGPSCAVHQAPKHESATRKAEHPTNNTLLGLEELEMLVLLRNNRNFMVHMRQRYPEQCQQDAFKTTRPDMSPSSRVRH